MCIKKTSDNATASLYTYYIYIYIILIYNIFINELEVKLSLIILMHQTCTNENIFVYL